MSDILCPHPQVSDREDEPKTPVQTWLGNSSHSDQLTAPQTQQYKVSKAGLLGLVTLVRTREFTMLKTSYADIAHSC
jgi:hypothetical protein